MEFYKTRAAVLSPAAISFKRYYGKRNHNLVTAILGLEILSTEGKKRINSGAQKIDFNDIAPSYLKNSWVVTKDELSHSISSSMQYVLFSSLNLIVDAVDYYFKSLMSNKYLLPDNIKKRLNDDGEGVKDRHDIIMEFLVTILNENLVDKSRLTIDSTLFHFTRELRNSWIHSDERKNIKQLLINLEPYKDTISSKYKHFNPWDTCSRFEKKDLSLTLKDVASLWASAERLVEQIDVLLIANKGVNSFFSCIMTSYFEKLLDGTSIKNSAKLNDLKKGRIRKFINDGNSKVLKKIKAILEQEAGFNRQWSEEDLLNFPLGCIVKSYFEWIVQADKYELEQHFLYCQLPT